MSATPDELRKLLKEARTIIRASLSRGLYKDFDQRVTKALAKDKPYTGPLDNPTDFKVDMVPLPQAGGFAPLRLQGVKVTHLPTGISHTSTAQRSAHTNRAIAWGEVQAALKHLRTLP